MHYSFSFSCILILFASCNFAYVTLNHFVVKYATINCFLLCAMEDNFTLTFTKRVDLDMSQMYGWNG
jgi:hypothetical protein